MKILNLYLRAFGCFTETELHFGEGRPNFHLLYGPNEAGKSTAMRAIFGLFFGIPHFTPDAFKHDQRNLRIGADLVRSDGQRRLQECSPGQPRLDHEPGYKRLDA